MAVSALLTTMAPMLFDMVAKAIPDKEKAAEVNAQLSAQFLDDQSAIAKAAANVVVAEVQGESWLQRLWRPLMMIWFGFLVGAYWLGYTPENLSQASIDHLFLLVQVGIGGYIGGRSGEKIAKIVKG